ncbi:MAG: polyprotein [Planktothrix sp.]
MRTYSASGDRIVVGYITGKQGQYEVFHRSPHSPDLYFRNSATNRSTGFRVKSNENYIGPDGAAYYNNASVIAAIQNCYNLRKYK